MIFINDLIVICQSNSARFCPFPITVIQPNAQNQTDDKNSHRAVVDQVSGQVGAGEFQDQEVYVRIAGVVKTELPPHIPVPVGAEAITPTVPNTKAKPRQRREQERDEVPFSQLRKHPPECVEKRPAGMKNEEKIVEQMQHLTANFGGETGF